MNHELRSRISRFDLLPRDTHAGRRTGVRRMLLLAALYVAPAALSLLHARPCMGGLTLDGSGISFSGNSGATWTQYVPYEYESAYASFGGTASTHGASARAGGAAAQTANGGPYSTGQIWGGGFLSARASAGGAYPTYEESYANARVDVAARLMNESFEQVPWQLVYGIGPYDGFQNYIDGGAGAFDPAGQVEFMDSFVISIGAVRYGGASPVGIGAAAAAFVYAPKGESLPGTTKSNPLLPQDVDDKDDVASEPPPPPPPVDDEDDEPGAPPAEVSGMFLTASASTFVTPVVADYGRTDMLYFDPVWSTSYLYTVSGNLFTSVLLPDPVPGGDSEFLVRYGLAGEYTQTLTAGTPLNFSTLVPGGVPWFLLSGVDYDAAPDLSGTPPFVTGLTFANDGVAVVQIRAALESDAQSPNSVPEPSSLIVMSVLGVVFGAARRRKREESIAA